MKKVSEVTKEKEDWYDKYQKVKAQNLEKESETIKLKSQLAFTKKQVEDLECGLSKLKSENERYRMENK